MTFRDNLSGSRMGILKQCGWAFDVGNDYVEAHFESSGADTGLAVHDALQKLVTTGCPEGLAPDVQVLVESARQKLQERGFFGPKHPTCYAEPAFAWSPTKGARKLGENISRAYVEHGLLPGEIPCSLDLVYKDGDVWIVADYKTGFAAHVDPPRTNEQLRFGALVVMQWLKATGIECRRIRLEVWKVRPDRTWVDEALLNVLDLAALERETALLVGRIPGSPARAGDKCQWCPALGSCPESRQQMTALAPLGDFEWSGSITGPDHAAILAMNLPNLEKAIKAVRKAVQDYAAQNGGEVLLPGGKTYRECASTRKSLNTTALKEKFGEALNPFYHSVEVKSWRVCKRSDRGE